jgi:hypothetical protein
MILGRGGYDGGLPRRHLIPAQRKIKGQRFGQLIVNALRNTDGPTGMRVRSDRGLRETLFYIENDELRRVLSDYLDRYWGQ